jgi:D-alanyl-lipoteichoic acid acyltransferase DltB (MBOAT superfamily)
MSFISLDFALFLPIVFLLYWVIGGTRVRSGNLLLVVASYVFYGWWDYRFLALIFLSTVVDYLVGREMCRNNKPFLRKALLGASLFVNLGALAFFKYCNFFIDTFVDAFSIFGLHFNPYRLNVILPVGISFYTFQTLSYTIDVYRREIDATRDFVAFCAFVSFFPQLVAGPIERAKSLLPQFLERRQFDYQRSVDGLRQMLWGIFKKVVIADNCAKLVNLVFSSPADFSGSTLVLGAVFFAFQIYGDFSGYSDIAIGTARLFGFRLMTNFSYPYFSRDIAEFWRRWHISLTTWFRDYLYIPLGGSRGRVSRTIRNIFIIFLVSGLWHGANLTFVAWGLLNALYFLPLFLLHRNRTYLGVVAKGRHFPPIGDFFRIVLTFGLTVFAWVFFRAESIGHAIRYYSGIFSPSLFSLPSFPGIDGGYFTLCLIALFLLIEWWGRNSPFAISRIGLSWYRPFRWGMYYAFLMTIVYFGGEPQDFIYFQF